MAQATKSKKIFDNRYEILEIVGRGARSVVYRARHINPPASEVALKVLLDEKEGRDTTEKLRKEALAMVSSRHKYVLRLDDFHSVGTLCYLTLEYAPESDLRKYVGKLGGQLGTAQGELFLEQCADALSFVHRAGIIHRDIKPDNILVVNPREIRIADFGIALLPGEKFSLAELERGVGTMSYMAPEILEGQGCDGRSDIYALGVAFYEMLSGKHPFEQAPLARQLDIRRDGEVPTLAQLIPGFPEQLSELILRCMRFDPNQRFSTAKELSQILREKGTKKDPKPEPVAVTVNNVVAVDFGAEKRAPQVNQEIPDAGGVKLDFEALNQAKNKIESTITQSDQTVPASSEAIYSNIVSIPEYSPASTEAPSDQPEIAKYAQVEQISPMQYALSGQQSSYGSAQEMVNSDFDSGAVMSSAVPAENDNNGYQENHNTPYLASAVETLVMNEPVDLATLEQANDSQGLSARDRLRSNQGRFQADDISSSTEKSKLDFSSTRVKAKSGSKFGRFVGIIVVVGLITILVQKGYIGIPFSSSSTETLTEDQSQVESEKDTPRKERFLPQFNSSETLSFPDLPAGSYQGTIRQLIPGKNPALVILSNGPASPLVVLIGLTGWTPTTVTPSAEGKPLRVSAQGIVLDLTAKVENGELIGSYKNLITNEVGSWVAKPAGQKQTSAKKK